jgi:uncharacterized protein (TIGR00369 family)
MSTPPSPTHPSPELAAQTLQQWLADEAAVRKRWADVNAKPGVALPSQAKAMTGLELFAAIFAGELPHAPIGHTLDFAPIEVAFGHAVFQGTPREQHYNPLGTVHGGWFSTLLDSALGCAVHTTLAAGKAYTTLELKVNIIRALTAKVPVVRAIGTVVHLGGQVATAEAKLVAADGKLYAHATTTCLIFDFRG